MQLKNVKFEKSLSSFAQFSGDDLPEVAVVGRSNVGKSSFINMLANNNKLAKTSSEPGRTRLINLFNVNGEFRLVDLPGYGYAKATTEEQNKWAKMIEEYLSQSANLKACVLLVDIRHAPTQKDVQMLNYLVFYNIPVLIVATKLDKIKSSEKRKCVSIIASSLKTGIDNVICVSNDSGKGRDEIVDKILQVAKTANL
ncbi:MAG: YihA family ribosome biogenesis GTP-binding protein [Clostridia bacterium]|nr:YihA family ribosome biogenesis GTP-binding protein [Clostridia bacterium]